MKPRSITPGDVLEGYIVDKVKKRFASTGWIHRKMVYQNRRGAPDDWFFGHGARLVIIEFKKPKKSATIQQKREHDRLIERGFKVYVVNSLEQGYALHARLEETWALS